MCSLYVAGLGGVHFDLVAIGNEKRAPLSPRNLLIAHPDDSYDSCGSGCGHAKIMPKIPFSEFQFSCVRASSGASRKESAARGDVRSALTIRLIACAVGLACLNVEFFPVRRGEIRNHEAAQFGALLGRIRVMNRDRVSAPLSLAR